MTVEPVIKDRSSSMRGAGWSKTQWIILDTGFQSLRGRLQNHLIDSLKDKAHPANSDLYIAF